MSDLKKDFSEFKSLTNRVIEMQKDEIKELKDELFREQVRVKNTNKCLNEMKQLIKGFEEVVKDKSELIIRMQKEGYKEC